MNDSPSEPLLDPQGAQVTSIKYLNSLPQPLKESYYKELIPPEVFQNFGISSEALTNQEGQRVVKIFGHPEREYVTLEVRHRPEDKDCILFFQVADTPFYQIELSFLIINDPFSERFNIDVDEQGNETLFGTISRNLKEEERAMGAGLAPGQVRRGLKLSGQCLQRAEAFFFRMGKNMLFLEPLFYHEAVIYERHGFGYYKGKAFMEEIDRGFAACGTFYHRLDGSTPFRQKGQEKTAKGRSWAIHDGILGQPWESPKMYKPMGKALEGSTFPDFAY